MAIERIRELLKANGNKVSFIEKDHKYIELVSGKFTEIPSTTTKLKMGGIGKEFVMTPHLQKAVDRGRYVHRVMELFLNNGDSSPEVFSYIAEKENVDMFVEHYEQLMYFYGAYCNFPEHWEVVATEQIFYDKENNIAGSIDAILYNRLQNEIIIVDWKTGKEKMPDHAQVAIYAYAVKKILEKEFPDLTYRKELVYYGQKN